MFVVWLGAVNTQERNTWRKKPEEKKKKKKSAGLAAHNIPHNIP